MTIGRDKAPHADDQDRGGSAWALRHDAFDPESEGLRDNGPLLEKGR